MDFQPHVPLERAPPHLPSLVGPATRLSQKLGFGLTLRKESQSDSRPHPGTKRYAALTANCDNLARTETHRRDQGRTKIKTKTKTKAVSRPTHLEDQGGIMTRTRPKIETKLRRRPGVFESKIETKTGHVEAETLVRLRPFAYFMCECVHTSLEEKEREKKRLVGLVFKRNASYWLCLNPPPKKSSFSKSPQEGLVPGQDKTKT